MYSDANLGESEEKYRTLFECSSEGVFVLSDVVLDCNEQLCRLFGESRDQVLGRPPSDFWPPVQPDGSNSLEEAGRLIAAALAGEPQHFEWQHRASDGRLIDTEVSIKAVTVAGTQVVLGTLHDITERKQAEQKIRDYALALEVTNEALRRANEAAEAATRAKSEFLANMSHEIRTPLTAILGFAEILVEQVRDPESVASAETVRRNGEFLLRLINDILDLSKVEAGKLDVECVDCSPQAIVADVAAMVRVQAGAKGLPVAVAYDGPIPATIRSDPTRLRQILLNLLGNAVKFTEVGSIRLVARLVQDRDRPARLCFEVVDTGIGLDLAQIARLFEPFCQGDATTSRRFGGSGLGLAISRRLARFLGGDIQVTSIPGKGSKFSLTVATGPLEGVPLLQYTDRPAGEPEPPCGEVASPPRRLDCRILLAEDGPDNQRLITFLLKKTGAEVTVACDGQDALDKAQACPAGRRPFDLILMDMQMPVMDGYEATRRLRQAGYDGPIIALTAHAMKYDRDKCLEAGCDDYLAKPVNRDKLLETVSQYAGQASSRATP
jgi:PAS domain S-box-containing protein